jgi:YVTN family beta-propeller protein
MRLPTIALSMAAAAALSSLAAAQNAQVSNVAVDPNDSNLVWTCNRDNDSVSVVDIAAETTLNEIDVGIRPRSLAFSTDGTKLFVANQRGNVPHDMNFVTPFTGAEVRGSVTVIDVASKTVSTTLTLVGTEAYGVAAAPNGKWFAVTGFRSATVKFFDTTTLAEVFEHAYEANLNLITGGSTVADVDSNQDGMADVGEPRGFVISSDSTRLFVSHHRSPFVSVLDLTLSGSGLPTSVNESRINYDTYAFDPLLAPTPVQNLLSQGKPRFGEDVALSPDGTRVLVPHVLHNVNHDVNFAFPGLLPGDFANRVYPALTMIDAVNLSYGQGGDTSNRLEHELSEPFAFAEYIMVGDPTPTSVGLAMIGGANSPKLGTKVKIWVEGMYPGQTGVVHLGRPDNIPMGSMGTFLVKPRITKPIPPGGGLVTFNLPNNPLYEDLVARGQAVLFDAGGQPEFFSNGLDIYISSEKYENDTMGRRAGHPSRVAFNAAGDRALMLNRGSEDLFLYSVAGSEMKLQNVFPKRFEFTERAALDTTSPMGDLPLGMAIADDPSTSNDDALVYVMNETTRTLSVLRVGWETNSIFKEKDQIPTLLNADKFSVSVRTGNELFEDASRGQTTGASGTVGGFNNSCASCHFEGGEDGNIWQRPNGPRTTMPVYDGTLLTGLVLWKGVRLNMGETGPMFGGENGGHGLLTTAEQQALIDYHETIPVPLNPNLDPVTGQYSPTAAIGADLFHGRNDTGTNGTGRHAGCFECHPDEDLLHATFPGPRAFTVDFLDPALSLTADTLGGLDPDCTVLVGNNVEGIQLRNVNTGVNIDLDNNGVPDLDRNADGFRDTESYTPMNTDKNDDFQRDDPNGYQCPDINNPGQNLTFARGMRFFSIPTKLGVFSTGPYFHDHIAFSLRALVDPVSQIKDPVYGTPAYLAVGKPELPEGKKTYNDVHDVRGHEKFAPLASKVQLNLQSVDKDADVEAILAYIQSL